MILYKHMNNTDIAFELIKKYYIPEKDAYSMKVRWYRVRWGRILWCLHIMERHRIDRYKFLHEWEGRDYI